MSRSVNAVYPIFCGIYAFLEAVEYHAFHGPYLITWFTNEFVSGWYVLILLIAHVMLNFVSEEHCPDKVPEVKAAVKAAVSATERPPRQFPDAGKLFHTQRAIIWNLDAEGNRLPETGIAVPGPTSGFPVPGAPGPSLIR